MLLFLLTKIKICPKGYHFESRQDAHSNATRLFKGFSKNYFEQRFRLGMAKSDSILKVKKTP
jgi:hypothetical protein